MFCIIIYTKHIGLQSAFRVNGFAIRSAFLSKNADTILSGKWRLYGRLIYTVSSYDISVNPSFLQTILKSESNDTTVSILLLRHDAKMMASLGKILYLLINSNAKLLSELFDSKNTKADKTA